VVRTVVAQANDEAEAWPVQQGRCRNGGGRSERGGRRAWREQQGGSGGGLVRRDGARRGEARRGETRREGEEWSRW
jgi:hypothetical protein